MCRARRVFGQWKAAMNGSATFRPAGEWDPARPGSTSEAAVRSVDRPGVDVARDVMTRDPDRVACGDTLTQVAGRMRNLLVAFLPVCDRNGDLQGIIALRDLPGVDQGGDPTGATAFCLAEEPAVTIGVDDPVDPVWDLMAEQRMWLLPVLDGRRLAGVIHYGPSPRRRTPRSAGPPFAAGSSRDARRDPRARKLDEVRQRGLPGLGCLRAT